MSTALSCEAPSPTPEVSLPPIDSPGRPLLLRTAREVADDLAADAVDRDHAGKPPVDEAGRLRDAGLPAALTPPGRGRGTDWRTGCAVIQEVAAADSAIGELLARHYVHGWDVRFYGSADRASAPERTAVHGGPLWAGAVHASAADPAGAGPELTLTPTGAAYLLHGTRAVDTAVTVADQFLVDAVCTVTGDVLLVRVPADRPGVSVEPATDRLGQRVAGAGTVAFDGVPVDAPQVIGVRPPDEEATPPFTALAPSALRLALAHVGLGILHGALAEARDLSRNTPHHHRTHHPAALPPAEDPDLLLAFGELASATHTATAVVERATDTLAAALAPGAVLDGDQPADIAALVATAESVTTRAALQLTARVLELADTPGLDRHWRNARTLTAHRSPAHLLRGIGDHYLNTAYRH
ncbi:acyl-CoA dehydrogenase [Streptomyces lichenis]|uniref:Acyl-CoA dehydrogenase n=1 Tax=Streptomyces lichenis TaxID=2306967 RepID=A0ABT0IFD9_9ACTN|nr:acyl-CoA dehydrogenase [Streptomyces lichenis]MCK8680011.1 acyl-CoA dehydrogenase [Streptomyces lichenis]